MPFEWGIPGTEDVFDLLAKAYPDELGEPIMDAVSDSPVHAFQFTSKGKAEAFNTPEGWKAQFYPFQVSL